MSELFILLRGSALERTDASKVASFPPARIILANLGWSGIFDSKRPSLVISNCSFTAPSIWSTLLASESAFSFGLVSNAS